VKLSRGKRRPFEENLKTREATEGPDPILTLKRTFDEGAYSSGRRSSARVRATDEFLRGSRVLHRFTSVQSPRTPVAFESKEEGRSAVRRAFRQQKKSERDSIALIGTQ